MGWQELLKMDKGQESDYEPEELKAEIEPIFEISEVIRPRLVLIARLPDRSDVLFGISFDKEKKAFQARMRYRDPKGNKQIIRPSKWCVFDEQTHQHRKHMAIRRFQEFAKETGAKITKLEFGPNATNQQIIDAFSSSRAFDILTFDPKKAKAKKLA